MANPQVCVFNPITTLIDQIASTATGPAAAGTPVVTNANGVLDTSLLGLGTTAIAGQTLGTSTLVNLYESGGVLHCQAASAQASGTPVSGSYPLPARGFVALPSTASAGTPVTVSLFGTYAYADVYSEFSASNIGQTVYLSDRGDGSVTPTPPSGVGTSGGTKPPWRR